MDAFSDRYTADTDFDFYSGTNRHPGFHTHFHHGADSDFHLDTYTSNTNLDGCTNGYTGASDGDLDT